MTIFPCTLPWTPVEPNLSETGRLDTPKPDLPMLTLAPTTLSSLVELTTSEWCARAISAKGYHMDAEAGSSRTSIKFENQPVDPAEAAVT